MVLTIKYKNIDTSLLEVKMPKKSEKGNYISKLLYEDKNFYIQTPVLQILSNKKARIVNLDSEQKEKFYKVMTELTHNIKKQILEKSKEFFNGKIFSETRINNSFENFIYNDDNSVFLEFNLDDDVKYVDFLNSNIPEYTEYPFLASCMLSINSVNYNKTKIIPDIKVKGFKISEKNLKEDINDNCILDFEETDSMCIIEEDSEEMEDNIVDDLDFF
jgi:hypothetical protein